MKARKEYVCMWCQEIIERGTEYVRIRAFLQNPILAPGNWSEPIKKKFTEDYQIHLKCYQEVEAKVDPFEFLTEDLGAKYVSIKK